MTERKPNRPRIDTILNAIQEGTYDDKLPELRQAIEGRLDAKREQIEALVKEVYGPDAQIISGPVVQNVPPAALSGQGPVQLGQPWHEQFDQPPPHGPAPAPSQPQGQPDENLGEEHESRSPLIFGGPPS